VMTTRFLTLACRLTCAGPGSEGAFKKACYPE
jgi:hypothetical protein